MMKIHPMKTLLAKVDGLVYKLDSLNVYNGGRDYHEMNLELICGWDYIDPDMGDEMGWCKPDRFVESVRSETVPLYYLWESAEAALKENGYEIIDEAHVSKFNKFL